MKAVVYTRYGSPDVLHLTEVDKPIPGDDEVLVKVYAVSLNAADRIMLTGKPVFVRLMLGAPLKPKNPILGADIAGRVEAVGKNVTAFQPGDEVFGSPSVNHMGGLAEYAVMTEDRLVMKPARATFEEAASLPIAGVTALQGLRGMGKIQAGQQVLVNGASGGVGMFSLLIAKAYGAEVTAVCSTRNQEVARALGADHVIDYTQEDFTRSGKQYDLILAANGYHALSDYQRALAPGGIYVCAGGTMRQIFEGMLFGPRLSRRGGVQMGTLSATVRKDDLLELSELLAAGKIRPVIDACYSLDQTPDAFRHLIDRHAQGKIVVMVADSAT